MATSFDELNESDIDVLLEAVESWEKEPMSDGLSSMLLVGMFSDKEDRKGAMQAAVDEHKEQARIRKEAAIMIKAKLVVMRSKATVREVQEYLNK